MPDSTPAAPADVEGTVPSSWFLDEKIRRQAAEAEAEELRESLAKASSERDSLELAHNGALAKLAVVERERDDLIESYVLRCVLAHEREDQLGAERDEARAELRQARVEAYDKSDCTNGPDEYGNWPCDPQLIFGADEAECSICGRIAKWPHD